MMTLRVPEMMCSNCVRRITNALNAQSLKFTVSLADKSVALDEEGDKVQAAIEALAEVGFDAERA